MSRTKLMAGSCFAMVLALFALGCAGSAGKAPAFDPTTGNHPATWIQDHYADYAKNPDQCRGCHGSTVDPTLAGGISKVSCFSCHAAGPNHPSNWALPGQHGRLGAQLAPVTTAPGVVPVMAGFAHCAKCHGSTYDNGIAVSCKSCHTTAPHPARPWASGTSTTAPSHIYTNQANVTECAKCHLDGANSTLKPLITTTDPKGSAPGCFNNTLCHSTNIKR